MTELKQYRVVVSSDAEADLENIYRYIAFASFSPETGREQKNRLLAALRSLKRLPMRQRVFIKDYRQLNVGPYAVIYSVDDDVVSICRIFHSSMDIVSRIAGKSE